jgi:hypothetical protein
MPHFDLRSLTDDEIDLITAVLSRWSERNHIDVKSEHGQAALKHAIALVNSGVKSPDALVARLDEVCAPPPAEFPLSHVGE